MPVTVRSREHRVVHVLVHVMTIVVAVRVLVFERLVRVHVAVRLREMYEYPAEHEEATGHHQPTGRAVTESESESGTNEWRERKHRPCAGGTEGALRQKVEAQA